MINAIAFDFVGVFVRENDFVLDPIEQILERKFGTINLDNEFFQWAQVETKLSKVVIEQKVKHIIDNIYDLRESDIFSKLPKLKFSTATNHLSYLDNWFKTLPISNNFQYFVNSAVVKAQKPDKEFYGILVKTLSEKPESVLFIDDNLENCEEAKRCGLETLHYDRTNKLSNEILERLNSQSHF